MPTVADARAEIDAAERVERRGRIIPADGVVSALRWLIGAKDGIPIPGRQPPGGWGHLVGGRGVVVRSEEELNRIIERAKEGRPNAPTEWDGAWCLGTIAVCEWVLGIRSKSPIRDTPRPMHGPTGLNLGREETAAEDASRQLGRALALPRLRRRGHPHDPLAARADHHPARERARTTDAQQPLTAPCNLLKIL